jgi:hypothetical protein
MNCAQSAICNATESKHITLGIPKSKSSTGRKHNTIDIGVLFTVSECTESGAMHAKSFFEHAIEVR